MPHNKRAFTIVELVVVIVVVAILSAILIPVFGSVVTRAQFAADTANVKTLNQGLAVYLATGETKLPQTNEDGEFNDFCEKFFDKFNCRFKLSSYSVKNHFEVVFDLNSDKFYLTTQENLLNDQIKTAKFGAQVVFADGKRVEEYTFGDGSLEGIFTVNGQKRWLLGSTGTPLAEVISGFHNVSGAEDFNELADVITALPIAQSRDLVRQEYEKTVFVTNSGSFKKGQNTAKKVIFQPHISTVINMIEIDGEQHSISQTTPLADVEKIVLPNSVTRVEKGSLTMQSERSLIVVDFGQNAAQTGEILCESFTNCALLLNGVECKVQTDKIIDNTGAEIVTLNKSGQPSGGGESGESGEGEDKPPEKGAEITEIKIVKTVNGNREEITFDEKSEVNYKYLKGARIELQPVPISDTPDYIYGEFYTFSCDNESVAKISGNTIEVVGDGCATITVSVKEKNLSRTIMIETSDKVFEYSDFLYRFGRATTAFGEGNNAIKLNFVQNFDASSIDLTVSCFADNAQGAARVIEGNREIIFDAVGLAQVDAMVNDTIVDGFQAEIVDNAKNVSQESQFVATSDMCLTASICELVSTVTIGRDCVLYGNNFELSCSKTMLPDGKNSLINLYGRLTHTIVKGLPAIDYCIDNSATLGQKFDLVNCFDGAAIVDSILTGGRNTVRVSNQSGFVLIENSALTKGGICLLVDGDNDRQLNLTLSSVTISQIQKKNEFTGLGIVLYKTQVGENFNLRFVGDNTFATFFDVDTLTDKDYPIAFKEEIKSFFNKTDTSKYFFFSSGDKNYINIIAVCLNKDNSVPSIVKMDNLPNSIIGAKTATLFGTIYPNTKCKVFGIYRDYDGASEYFNANVKKLLFDEVDTTESNKILSRNYPPVVQFCSSKYLWRDRGVNTVTFAPLENFSASKYGQPLLVKYSVEKVSVAGSFTDSNGKIKFTDDGNYLINYSVTDSSCSTKYDFVMNLTVMEKIVAPTLILNLPECPLPDADNTITPVELLGADFYAQSYVSVTVGGQTAYYQHGVLNLDNDATSIITANELFGDSFIFADSNGSMKNVTDQVLITVEGVEGEYRSTDRILLRTEDKPGGSTDKRKRFFALYKVKFEYLCFGLSSTVEIKIAFYTPELSNQNTNW